MNVRFKSRLPWALAFSFARAIQQPALEIWQGKEANVLAAQQALYHRARCNQAARRGKYDAAMEGVGRSSACRVVAHLPRTFEHPMETGHASESACPFQREARCFPPVNRLRVKCDGGPRVLAGGSTENGQTGAADGIDLRYADGMDLCPYDVRIAQPERHWAELERRLAEVEADNQRLCADNHRLKADVRRLTERLAQYEPEIRHEATRPESDPARRSAYSLESETKRRQRRKRRRKKKSPGRRPTELKFSDTHRHDNIYPDGVRHGDCHLARERSLAAGKRPGRARRLSPFRRSRW